MLHKALRAFLAALLLWAAPAAALPPVTHIVVLGGVPSGIVAGSALTLNFARNGASGGFCAIRYSTVPCTSLITTTRASTGYAQWADGHLSSFAANIPRITDLGLLVEQAATNLALQSQTFDNASWTKNNTTITAAAATAPDGTLTGQNLTPATGSNNKVLYVPFTATAVPYSASFYTKTNGGRWIALSFGSDAVNDGAFFDLTNGVVGTVAASTTATISALGSGWYRCTITRTLIAATRDVEIEPHSADNQSSTWNSAAGAEKFFVWGAQVELGSVATSYIPTTTVAVLRAADSIAVSNPAVILTASGTIVIKYNLQGTNTNQGEAWAMSDTGNNRLALRAGGGNTTPSFLVGSGSGVGSASGSSTGTGVDVKIASTWGTSAAALSQNGAAAVSVGNGWSGTSAGTFWIGRSENATTQPDGFIKSFTALQTQVSNVQLQGLSQ